MSEGSTAFGRLLAALPTPFDERGRTDEPALDHLVGYFSERDVSGLAILTEVGEAAFLETSEQRAIVERVARKAGQKKPFWVELGQAATRAAVEAARHAEDNGAEGLLLALPSLPDVGYSEAWRHVDRVGRASGLPIRLVVRPGDLPSQLAPEEQSTLVKHPRLGGVFVGEGGASPARAWARRVEDTKGEVLGACSFEVLETGKSGVTGVVCALSVLAPEPARTMLDAVQRGEADAPRRIHKRMKPAIDRLGPPRPADAQTGVERFAERIARRPLNGGRRRPLAPPGLVKEGLRLQGHRIKAFVRPPQPQVTEEDRERLRALMKACGMLG